MTLPPSPSHTGSMVFQPALIALEWSINQAFRLNHTPQSQAWQDWLGQCFCIAFYLPQKPAVLNPSQSSPSKIEVYGVFGADRLHLFDSYATEVALRLELGVQATEGLLLGLKKKKFGWSDSNQTFKSYFKQHLKIEGSVDKADALQAILEQSKLDPVVYCQALLGDSLTSVVNACQHHLKEVLPPSLPPLKKEVKGVIQNIEAMVLRHQEFKSKFS